MIAVAFAALGGCGIGLLFNRRRIRSFRELIAWQGEEIEARKIADHRDSAHRLRISGETPVVEGDTRTAERPFVPADSIRRGDGWDVPEFTPTRNDLQVP